MTDHELPPPRLLDRAGPAGDCVRRALSQQEVSVPRFVQLREKRLKRQRLARGAWALAACAVGLVLLPRLRHEPAQPSIRAEQPGSMVVTERSLAQVSAVTNEPAREASAVTSTAAPTAAPKEREAPRANARTELATPRAASSPSAAAVTAERPASGSAKACAELARSGAPEDALRCYEKLASGSGMSAELALFEQARLEGKVLRQPARALATLDAHRRRFPQGSLRAEVMLAQIEWLVAAGEQARARALVDEALASGLVRERSAELERLRASLP